MQILPKFKLAKNYDFFAGLNTCQAYCGYELVLHKCNTFM